MWEVLICLLMCMETSRQSVWDGSFLLPWYQTQVIRLDGIFFSVNHLTSSEISTLWKVETISPHLKLCRLRLLSILYVITHPWPLGPVTSIIRCQAYLTSFCSHLFPRSPLLPWWTGSKPTRFFRCLRLGAHTSSSILKPKSVVGPKWHKITIL